MVSPVAQLLPYISENHTPERVGIATLPKALRLPQIRIIDDYNSEVLLF
jgi:hypothetical protein